MDVKNLASNIDIVPTILAACGLKPTRKMPGINLLDSVAASIRTTIFGENYCHDMANVDRPAESLRARTCIQNEWKLIVWQNPQPKIKTYNTRRPEEDVELFNLEGDPLEENNLAQKHPAKVAEMLTQLNEWWDPTTAGNKKDARDGL
jgi:uncharacterized sulfatase